MAILESKIKQKLHDMGIPVNCPTCNAPLRFSGSLGDEVYFICPGMCGYRRVLSEDEKSQIAGMSHHNRSKSLRTLLSDHEGLYDRIRRLADTQRTTMENVAFRLLELGIEKVDSMPRSAEQAKIENIKRYKAHIANGLTMVEISRAEGITYNGALANIQRYGLIDKVPRNRKRREPVCKS